MEKGKNPEFEEEMIEIDLREYINVIWDHKYIIVGFLLAAIILSYIISLQLTNIYEASTRIMVKKDDMFEDILKKQSNYSMINTNKVAIYMELIKSQRILNMVIEELDLTESKTGDYIKADSLKNKLDISSSNETNMINIHINYPDPELARDIANLIVEKLQKENQRLNKTNLTNVSEFVDNQLKKTKKKLDTLEEDLLEFKKNNNFIIIEERKDTLHNELLKLERKQEEKLNELENLNQKLNTVEDKDLKKDLQENKEQLQDTISDDEKRIEKIKKDLIEVAEKEIKMDELKREIRTTENIYELLMEQNEENQIKTAMQSSDITIVDKAVVNNKPVKPNVKLNIVIAAMLGLFVSIGVIFIIEFLDTTIKTEDDLKNFTDLPVLGVVPLLEDIEEVSYYEEQNNHE